MNGEIRLRDASSSDAPVFARQQSDVEAGRMAGFPPRTEEEFLAHWEKTARDPANRRQAILYEGELAGYVGSFPRDGDREVCYWLGREFWGLGLATAALREYLKSEPFRPLHARVARHNRGSIRVLEKCGFVRQTADVYTNRVGEKIDEFVYRLDGPAAA
jgi:RimJ/RimL family protein N-acetyltransferase